ncbi:ParA family protein [Kitasatospora sp. NPDC048194]|uniref:ParA family protein n=1 Tax=Kitasatospora sp. NPDC048194 TaxID=3364045 RepID=UPI0037176DAE
MRIAVCNNKGGSAKTALVVNTAAALAEAGEDVDVYELDPQGNASRRLAARPTTSDVSISEAIKAEEPGCVIDALRPCGWGVETEEQPDGTVRRVESIYSQRIRVAGARFDLENRITELEAGAHLRLKTAIGDVDAGRISLFDTPPNLGHLTQLALAAVDMVILAVETEYDGVEGAIRVSDFIKRKAEALGNPDLHVGLVVPTHYRPGLNSHEFHLGTIPDQFPGLVWSAKGPDGEPIKAIHERAVIKDACDVALPLRLYGTGPGKEMAAVFDLLAARIIKFRKELAA